MPRISRRGLLQASGAAFLLDVPALAAGDPVFTNDGNPVVTNIYTADPDAFVHNGRLYLDTDRDEAPLGANDFVMREWHLYSTADLVEWTDHGARLSLADFPWANRNAWAAQMVQRDGKFFWYMPVQKASNNSMSIAVAVGDGPLGPFRDALGKPLIDNTLPNHSSFDIDPTVLVDDDGQAYIYWGSFSSPRAAKLKPNMVELMELDDPGGAKATGPRVPGVSGGAVRLNGSTEYVSLPTGIVGGLSDFTIAVWVNPAATPTWSRVFDFGTGTANYMFLTVNAGGGPRFAITTSGNGAEQQLNRAGQLPLDTWTHLAVTLSGSTGTLYVNGVAAAVNPAMTLRPAALGTTTQNSLGRSQFADPLLNATIDEFHVYGRALSAAEVQTLSNGDVAAYRFDEVGGAEALDSSGNGRTATIVSPPLVAVTPQGLTGYWEAPLLFKRNGVYYLAYARGNPRTGGNPATIDYATATRPLGPWTYRGRILDTVTNTTTNHCAIVEFDGQWYVVYHNGMLPGGGEFRRCVCIDKLYFDDDGTIRPVTQTLGPAALRPVWTLDAPVDLDGAGQFVTLPTGLLWNMYDFTVEAWVKPRSVEGNPHVFDFGTGPAVNMYLTPRSAAGTVRFAITTGGATREQRVDGTAPLPVGRWTHVAVTKSALVATLYVDGVQVGQNPNLGLYPARLGNTPNTWLGRSQNPADAYLDGELDDVRIHQRGLGAAELRATIVPGLVSSLKDWVTGQTMGAAVKHRLVVLLTQVLAYVKSGRNADAAARLDHDLVALVNAERGGQLTEAQAAELLRSAALIAADL